MAKYKATEAFELPSGDEGVAPTQVEAGSEVELTEEQAATLEGKVELVPESTEGGDASAASDEAAA
jgi:hypothetical protein